MSEILYPVKLRSGLRADALRRLAYARRCGGSFRVNCRRSGKRGLFASEKAPLHQWNRFFVRRTTKKAPHMRSLFVLEQVTGIEPALSAWEAEVLPLHHTCDVGLYYSASGAFRQAVWKIFCAAADTAAFQPPGPACHPGGQSALAGKIQPPNRRLPPLSGLAVKQLHRFEQDVHDQQELRKPHHF